MTEETKKDPTTAEKIWSSIKNIHIEMFGLPAQKIDAYCTPIFIDPNKLHLSYKIGALLPALETALASKYNVELADKYIVVSIKR